MNGNVALTLRGVPPVGPAVRLLRRCRLIALALACAGCGDGPVPQERIEIRPGDVRLATGSTAALAAQVIDASGEPITGAAISWTSSDPAVAPVSAGGVVNGTAAGVAEIQASTASASGKVIVTVAPAVLINIHAASHVIATGGQASFSGTALDASNEELVAQLSWSSTDPTVATVASNGTVTGLSVGVSTLGGTTPGASAQLHIAVQEPLQGQIAFVSEREPPYGDIVLRPDGGVYLMKADGTGLRKHLAYLALGCNEDRPGSPPLCPFPVNQPAMASDGLRMAVVAQVHWEVEYTDTVIELCATGPAPSCRQLDYPRRIRPPGLRVTLHGVRGPAWSPDGTSVAFTRAGGGIVVWNLASDAFVDIDTDFRSGEPAWSPDGQRIAFTSGESGSRAIWLINRDGSGRTRISPAVSDDAHPAWSPDGRRIALVRIEGGNADVQVMNIDGSGAVNLTRHPAQDRNPAWSPDGTRIAFDTDRDGNLEVYVMDADGANPVNLTRHPAPDFSPSWGP